MKFHVDQDLFSLKFIIKIKMASAAVVIGAKRVNLLVALSLGIQH